MSVGTPVPLPLRCAYKLRFGWRATGSQCKYSDLRIAILTFVKRVLQGGVVYLRCKILLEGRKNKKVFFLYKTHIGFNERKTVIIKLNTDTHLLDKVLIHRIFVLETH